MLCTSGFVDDVVFSHNGSMARRVYYKAAIEFRRCSHGAVLKVVSKSECVPSSYGEGMCPLPKQM